MIKQAVTLALVTALALAGALPVHATPPPTAILGTPPQPAWNALSAKQKTILAPLASDWNSMENIHRKQWLSTAARYPAMSETEKGRVQKRLQDWVKLSPEQRARARDNYRHLSQLPSEQKDLIKKKWSAYKNLPEDERQGVREKHKSAILLAPPPPPAESTTAIPAAAPQ